MRCEAGPSEGFGWPRHCADLAVAAVAEASGRDVWGEIGPSPRSWREAAAMYRRLGVRTLEAAVTAVLGPPLPSRRLAMRGDVAMVQGSLGVVRGQLVECLGGDGEAVHLPLGQACAVWAVLRYGPSTGSVPTQDERI